MLKTTRSCALHLVTAKYGTLLSKAVKMQDRTCSGDTMLTFMARNERYTYDEDGGMRLQDLVEVRTMSGRMRTINMKGPRSDA